MKKRDNLERIVEKIYDTTENNEISEFLKELVLAEAKSIGQWKEFYIRKVKEYMKKGGY